MQYILTGLTTALVVVGITALVARGDGASTPRFRALRVAAIVLAAATLVAAILALVTHS
jgi:hypothetical protein